MVLHSVVQALKHRLVLQQDWNGPSTNDLEQSKELEIHPEAIAEERIVDQRGRTYQPEKRGQRGETIFEVRPRGF